MLPLPTLPWGDSTLLANVDLTSQSTRHSLVVQTHCCHTSKVSAEAQCLQAPELYDIEDLRRSLMLRLEEGEHEFRLKRRQYMHPFRKDEASPTKN